VVGGLVIVLDPIFQGLAVSLIFGVIVATALTLVVIPPLYFFQLRHFPASAGMLERLRHGRTSDSRSESTHPRVSAVEPQPEPTHPRGSAVEPQPEPAHAPEKRGVIHVRQ
jgi:hypothetical protein